MTATTFLKSGATPNPCASFNVLSIVNRCANGSKVIKCVRYLIACVRLGWQNYGHDQEDGIHNRLKGVDHRFAQRGSADRNRFFCSMVESMINAGCRNG